jgi:DNA repair exonuclease SbcCD ATPase subunit
LRAKLKQKEKVQETNERLLKDLEDLKAKYQDSQKRQMQQSRQIEQLQHELKRVNEEKAAIKKEFKDFKTVN